MDIRRLESQESVELAAAGHLFDGAVDPAGASAFLERPGHHLLIAFDDGRAIGFITGVETTHPDKGTEMFLYELGVARESRRRGVGRALVAALGELARRQGCYGMWVCTESGNAEALATYRSAGAGHRENDVVVFSWDFTPASTS